MSLDRSITRVERGGEVSVKYEHEGDGTYAQAVDVPNHTIAFDPDADTPTYIGCAPPGTAKAATGWRIQKWTYSGGKVTDRQFPGGDPSHQFIWNDRASYTYS